MGMMFRRNKLRRLEAEEREKTTKEPESVKDKVPETKRRARKLKED